SRWNLLLHFKPNMVMFTISFSALFYQNFNKPLGLPRVFKIILETLNYKMIGMEK
ncbi:Hypothetical protein FKW44_000206, partial [Caligus rogercresseyi]